jgi:hypothetical protein
MGMLFVAITILLREMVSAVKEMLLYLSSCDLISDIRGILHKNFILGGAVVPG